MLVTELALSWTPVYKQSAIKLQFSTRSFKNVNTSSVALNDNVICIACVKEVYNIKLAANSQVEISQWINYAGSCCVDMKCN